MDLAQQSLPTRHHDFAAIDVDRDLLSGNLAEQIGDRHPPNGLFGLSFLIARPALLELTLCGRISIPGAHFRHPNPAFTSSTRRCQLGPKRFLASAASMTSISEGPRASGAKYFVAIPAISRAAFRSPLI